MKLSTLLTFVLTTSLISLAASAPTPPVATVDIGTKALNTSSTLNTTATAPTPTTNDTNTTKATITVAYLRNVTDALLHTPLPAFLAAYNSKHNTDELIDWEVNDCSDTEGDSSGNNFQPACIRHLWAYTNFARQNRFNATTCAAINDQLTADFNSICALEKKKGWCKFVSPFYSLKYRIQHFKTVTKKGNKGRQKRGGKEDGKKKKKKPGWFELELMPDVAWALARGWVG